MSVASGVECCLYPQVHVHRQLLVDGPLNAGLLCTVGLCFDMRQFCSFFFMHTKKSRQYSSVRD